MFSIQSNTLQLANNHPSIQSNDSKMSVEYGICVWNRRTWLTWDIVISFKYMMFSNVILLINTIIKCVFSIWLIFMINFYQSTIFQNISLAKYFWDHMHNIFLFLFIQMMRFFEIKKAFRWISYQFVPTKATPLSRSIASIR